MLNGLTANGFVSGGEHVGKTTHWTAELRFSSHQPVTGDKLMTSKPSLVSVFESSDDRYTVLGPPPQKEVLGVLAKTFDGRSILRQNDSYTVRSAEEVSEWTLICPWDQSGFHYNRT